jgi:hypothetical protein
MLTPTKWFGALQPRRMEIASDLWSAGVKAEFGYKSNPKMGDQLNYALEEVRLVVWSWDSRVTQLAMLKSFEGRYQGSYTGSAEAAGHQGSAATLHATAVAV